MKRIIILLLGMAVTQLNAFGYNKDKFHQQQPLSFEENKGQVTDQLGAARPDIMYRLSAPGMSVFIGNGQLHYQFYKQIENTSKQLDKVRNLLTKKQQPLPGTFVTYRMDVVLPGANTFAQAVAENPVASVVNYYTGNTGKNGAPKVRSYQKITYRDIYPGIDWVLYVKDSKLEYDFVVHPGANPQDIQLSYNGTTALNVIEAGSLFAQTPLGTITEHSPYAYQQENKQSIAVKFQLQGNTLRFATDPYAGTLVIDPGVDWATYFGGPVNEVATTVAFDSRGYVYMAGQAASVSNVATTGSYQDTLSGGIFGDAFLAKFDTLGNRIWATYYGGDSSDTNVVNTAAFFAGCDVASSVVVDEKNNYLYMAGCTNSMNNIATPGSYQDTLSAAYFSYYGSNYGTDAFLVQFDTAGVRNWGTYYGGDSSAEGFLNTVALALDTATGNIDIGMTEAGDNNMATAGAFQTVYAGTGPFPGEGECLIAQFNSQGARQWATYYGGESTEQLQSITIDQAGNLYIAGSTTSSTGIATPNSFLPTISPDDQTNGSAVFLAKLNSSATSRQWGTYYGQTYDFPTAVACDRFGHVYMSGATSTIEGASNPDVITTPGAWQTIFGGGGTAAQWDGFLVQFDTAGNRKWGTYYGGQQYDYGYNVACDYTGNAFLAGTTNSTSFNHPTIIASPGSHQDSLAGGSTNNGNQDAYLAEFDTTGHRLWGTYYGGLGNEGGGFLFSQTIGLACDGKGGAYMAGWTDSYTGIATPGSYEDTLGVDSGLVTTYLLGRGSAFLVRFVPVDIAITRVASPANDTVCAGSAPFVVELKNKGRMAIDSIQVKTIYTNNATGAKDSATAETTQLLSVSDSTSLQTGVLNLSAGTYTVQNYILHVTDDSSFTDDSLTIQLVAIEAPSITSINATNTGTNSYTFSADGAANITGYHWDFGDGNTANTPTASHTYANNGSYTVTLIGANGCGADTLVTTVTTNQGISAVIEAGASVALYPNPNTGQFTVDGTFKNDGKVSIDIADVTGRILYTEATTIKGGRMNRQINMGGDIAAGTYMLRLSTANGISIIPFIKTGN